MTSQVKTTRFWFAWTFASLLVYPLTAIFALAFSMVWFPTMEAVFPSATNYDYNYGSTAHDIYMLLTLTFAGGIVGMAVGLLQSKVIERYFQFSPKYWKRATVVGGLIAAPVMAFSVIGLSDYMSANYWQLSFSEHYQTLNSLVNVLPMVLYVTVMSAVQLFVLRHYVRNAWLWIIANAVAGFMFSMLVTVAFNPGFGDWLIAAIAQGAITGFAMLWLLHNLNKDNLVNDEPDYAYQHVPIDTDDSEPSIWDDAI